MVTFKSVVFIGSSRELHSTYKAQEHILFYYCVLPPYHVTEDLETEDSEILPRDVVGANIGCKMQVQIFIFKNKSYTAMPYWQDWQFLTQVK